MTVEQVKTTNTADDEIAVTAMVHNKPQTMEKTSDAYIEDVISINLAIDFGSTLTRSYQIIPGEQLKSSKIVTRPSEYVIIPANTDLEIYASTSSNLEDNFELKIEELESPYNTTTWFPEPMRVLKENMIKRTRKTPRGITNQSDKTDDIGIFINILCEFAAYSLMNRAKKVNGRLAFPLPSKERYSSSDRLQEVIRTIAGKYRLTFPRYGFESELTLEPGNIQIETEGETAYIFYTTTGKDAVSKQQEYSDKSVVVGDLGGSTFGLVLIQDGATVEGSNFTSKIGGDNLVSILLQQLSRKFKTPLSFEKAYEGIKTGTITVGAEVVPIGEELRQAKETLADALHKDVVTFLRQAMLHGTDIYSFLFVGRGMLPTGKIERTEEGVIMSANYSPSIAELLMQRYKEISETTKSSVLSNPGIANLMGTVILMKSKFQL